MKSMQKIWMVCLGRALVTLVYAEENEHDGGAESSVVELSAEEQRQAGIVVATITPRALNETVRVPGEVFINAYRSARVMPRITAQVETGHVRHRRFRGAWPAVPTSQEPIE